MKCVPLYCNGGWAFVNTIGDNSDSEKIVTTKANVYAADWNKVFFLVVA